MKLPGFNGAASLYNPSHHYQSSREAIKSSGEMISSISVAEWKGEVINVHSCAPGDIEVGSGKDAFCLPLSLLTFFGGLDWVPWPEPPQPPVPPGGGGGEGATSIPAEIVAECFGVCGSTGKDCCGGVGGPSPCKSCAQTVCQQQKCEKTGKCDPAVLDGAKEHYCDAGCPDIPGVCKGGLTVKRKLPGGWNVGVLRELFR